MIREVLKEKGKSLAVTVSLLVWSALAFLCFLLPRQDWQILAPPLLLAALLLAWPWMRPYRSSFLLVIVGVYGGLFFLEVGLRLAYFGAGALLDPARYSPYSALLETGVIRAASDPKLSLALVPGFDGAIMGREVRVNKFGFRGPEIEQQKRPNTLRVMSFGTSITMGLGVEEEKTYTAALGQLLQQKQPTPIEVINGGVGAYSLLNTFRYASIAAPLYRPDVVIVEISPGGLYETGEGGLDPEHSPVAAQLSTIERYSFAASALYPPANLRLKLSKLFNRSSAAPGSAQLAPSTAFAESKIKELTAQGKREGFSVVVLLVRPMSGFSIPDAELDARKRLASLTKECGAYFVDTYTLFDTIEMPDQFLVFPGDLHPNADAHARFASALLPVVEEAIEKK